VPSLPFPVYLFLFIVGCVQGTVKGKGGGGTNVRVSSLLPPCGSTWDQIPVVGLGGQYLYLMTHLVAHSVAFLR